MVKHKFCKLEIKGSSPFLSSIPNDAFRGVWGLAPNEGQIRD
jgi:hypothetical protein